MSRFRIGFPLPAKNGYEFVVVEPRDVGNSIQGMNGQDESLYDSVKLVDKGAEKVLTIAHNTDYIARKAFKFTHYSDRPHNLLPREWHDDSDTLACTLAICDTEKPTGPDLPIILISCACNFIPGNGFYIDKNGLSSVASSVEPLLKKWKSTEYDGVVAFVLKMDDAEKLGKELGIAINTFSPDILDDVKIGDNNNPLLIGLDSEQVPEFAETLQINPSYFSETSQKKIKGYTEQDIINWLKQKGYKDITGIGKGGIGIVFKAYNASQNKNITIKCLALEHWNNEKLKKRFRNGYNLLVRIHNNTKERHTNKNIVVPYEWLDDDDSCPCYSMEYVEGYDLYSFLENSPAMSFDERFQLFLKIVEAVSSAHIHGIFHRDLHPTNILIRKGSGDIVLTDFDMAYNPDTSLSTFNNPIVGHLLYIPPEGMDVKILNTPAKATYDIFQLGRLFHLVMLGRKPNVTDGANPPIYLESLKKAGLIEGLARIIINCVSQKESGRYQTIQSLKEDLELIKNFPSEEGDVSISIIDKTWISEAEKQNLIDSMKNIRFIGGLFAGLALFLTFIFLIIITVFPEFYSAIINDNRQISLPVLYVLWSIVTLENLYLVFAGPDDVFFLIEAGYRLDSEKLVAIGLEHIGTVFSRFISILVGAVTGDMTVAFLIIGIPELIHTIMWGFDFTMSKPDVYINPDTIHAKAAMKYYTKPHSTRILMEFIALVSIFILLKYNLINNWIAVISLGAIYLFHELTFRYYRNDRNKNARI